MINIQFQSHVTALGKVALPKFGWQQSKAITFLKVNSTFQLIGLGWLVGFFFETKCDA